MKQRDILLILIPTFLLVVLWIIFNIYHNSIESTVSKTVSAEVVPINPDFDFQTIENLKKREIIQPLYEISPINPSIPVPTEAKETSSVSANSKAAIVPTPTGIETPSADQESTIIQELEPSPTIATP